MFPSVGIGLTRNKTHADDSVLVQPSKDQGELTYRPQPPKGIF